MDVDRLNPWLNLAASVGVIIGLAFLVVEINQSNRIASYSAEHSRRNQFIELNTVRIENAEVVLGEGRVRWIHPDCGFWMLKRSVADRKIAALAAGRDKYLGLG